MLENILTIFGAIEKNCIFTKKIVINLKPNIMSSDKEAKLKDLTTNIRQT